MKCTVHTVIQMYKVCDNFANYFFKLKLKMWNEHLLYLLYRYNGYKGACEVKSKAKALRHFKVDPVLKIYATFHNWLDLCEQCTLYCLHEMYCTLYILVLVFCLHEIYFTGWAPGQGCLGKPVEGGVPVPHQVRQHQQGGGQ